MYEYFIMQLKKDFFSLKTLHATLVCTKNSNPKIILLRIIQIIHVADFTCQIVD